MQFMQIAAQVDKIIPLDELANVLGAIYTAQQKGIGRLFANLG
ncbi:MAG TPA: hypothetical protein VHL08_00720 [Dongiaceae bacterium]|jgi:hypothetical protein|nr:hypothetical protein [Dongiaceae bacterium]